MAQVPVRQAIHLLCAILKENGATEISAETFRLAKFNRDEATRPFWVLLFELLYFVKYKTVDEIPVKAIQDLSQEEIVVYVKREINRYGFTCHDFNTLPNDMSSGSRDLLLALGWLLCKESIIDQFMQRRGIDIGEDTALFHSLDKEASYKLANNNNWSNDPSEKVKYLLWLNGKLHSKMKQLYALQMEKTKYIHKIHESTQGVSTTPDRSHLSMLEVYLLRHPDALKKMLKLLDDDNKRLQNLLTWKQNHELFWKWMESVLDLKIKETEVVDKSRLSIPGDCVDEMNAAYSRLQRCISHYENQLEDLERLVFEKSSNISQVDLDELIKSIESEILFQETALSHNRSNTKMTSSSTRPRAYPKLAFYDQKKPGMANDFQNEKAALTNLESQVDLLTGKVVDLETILNKRQDNFKEELAKLSDQFRETIVVPPLSKKPLYYST
ncbi:tubulin epsilon and delta complex protein 1-like [Tubulanus polymorphus]|uniref:tubulin epsilon and delta complex protein 1-like n=1 Tax=Tubulanus polymorphus TaxID=672921 RepID=UPI003DA4AD73